MPRVHFRYTVLKIVLLLPALSYAVASIVCAPTEKLLVLIRTVHEEVPRHVFRTTPFTEMRILFTPLCVSEALALIVSLVVKLAPAEG